MITEVLAVNLMVTRACTNTHMHTHAHFTKHVEDTLVHMKVVFSPTLLKEIKKNKQ